MKESYLGFFWVLWAHSIGDMALQTTYIINNKQSKFMVLLAHSIIWAGCIGIALKYLNCYASWKMAFLIITHFLTDTWSVNKDTKHPGNWQKVNTIDQIIHFIQLVIVYVL